MRKRRLLLSVLVGFLAALIVVGAIAIIHPFLIGWDDTELKVEGLVFPDGALRGIHFYDTIIDQTRKTRLRAITVDVRLLAWEFTLTEHPGDNG